jgi:hypothetical protein
MDPKNLAARYEVTGTAWVDIREAKPRCRVKVKDPETRAVVLVGKDGTIDVSGAMRDIDQYEDEKYEQLRDEVV